MINPFFLFSANKRHENRNSISYGNRIGYSGFNFRAIFAANPGKKRLI